MIFNHNSSTKNVIAFEVSEKQTVSLHRYCADENLPFDGRNVRKISVPMQQSQVNI